MKPLAVIFVAVTVAASMTGLARASVPDLIPVQGVLSTADGQPIDGPTVLSFALYDAPIDGELLWEELYYGANALRFDGGLFIAYLGTLEPLAFEELLERDELWLSVTVGAEPPLERVRLTAVPYALEAHQCHQVGELAAEDIQPRINLDGDLNAGQCPEGQIVRGIHPETGAIECAEDSAAAATVLLASIGGQLPIIAETSPEQLIRIGIAVGDGALDAAAGNHDHDGVYLPSPPSCTEGSVLEYTAAGWDCGVDDDTFTTYTANAGLTMAETLLAMSHGGTGSATSVSRSDHHHNTAYLPSLTCTNGYMLKRTASGWECASDTDTNTTYSAGNGLSLTSTAFSVTFAGSGDATSAARSDHSHATAYLPGPTCSSGYLLKSSGTGWGCAADNDTNTTYSAQDGLAITSTTLSADMTYLQSPVSGSCSEGGAIRAVTAAGSVTCQQVEMPDPVRFANLNSGTTASVGLNWTQLNIGTRTFSKSYGAATSKVRLTLNSRLYSGVFAGGATAIQFQIRVNGTMPDTGGDYWLTTSDTTTRAIFSNYFTGLGAGTHTVTLWARTNMGTASNVIADSGGWYGSILVKEY